MRGQQVPAAKSSTRGKSKREVFVGRKRQGSQEQQMGGQAASPRTAASGRRKGGSLSWFMISSLRLSNMEQEAYGTF